MIRDFNASDDILSSTLCAAVDGRGFQEVVHAVHLGDSADTLSGTVKLELELEESNNGTTWNDVANTDLTNAVTGTNPGCFGVIDSGAKDSQIYWTEYRGKKRYTRVVLNFTGNHANGIPCAAWALRRGPQYVPSDGGSW